MTSKLQPDNLSDQAIAFGEYLLGVVPTKNAQHLFKAVISKNSLILTKGEQRLLQFGVRHTWALSYIDAGLVAVKPESEIRRRIYIMLGILECQPEYYAYFLPQPRSGWYIFRIGLTVIKSWLLAAIGIIVIKTAGL